MMLDLIEGAPLPEARPLLITYGAKDLFFIRNAAENWHQNTAQSTCAEIAGAGHIANQDESAVFNRLLNDFLNTVF